MAMVSNANGAYNVTIGNTGGLSKSNADFVKAGYGQVEPNHLGAQTTRQIYAQLPADAAYEMLEQGQFVKYDLVAGLCNVDGRGEWMLVFNELKKYEDGSADADYVMKKADYAAMVYNAQNEAMPAGTTMVPRVFKTFVGDIMTTNTIKATELAAGDLLAPDPADGYLAPAEDTDAGMLWQVAKVYTMPDGQPGAKITRVQ